MVQPIELVIFDSDGVLVDSEIIANRVMAEAATAAGAPMDLRETIALFRGRNMAFCIEEIERRSGRVIEEGFAAEVRCATALAFDRELKAVEGVHEALDLILCKHSGKAGHRYLLIALHNRGLRFEDGLAHIRIVYCQGPGFSVPGHRFFAAPQSLKGRPNESGTVCGMTGTAKVAVQLRSR